VTSAVAVAAVAAAILGASAQAGPAALPTLSINNTEGTNYQTAPSTMTFTVTLTPAASSTVTVDWRTRGDVDGDDFKPAAGTLSFAPGETSKPIVVELLPEPGKTFEEDEIMYVDLTNPVGATFTKDAGVGVIHFQPEPSPQQVNLTPTTDVDQCVKTVGSDICEPLNRENQFAIEDIQYVNPGRGKIDVHTTEGTVRFFGTPFDLQKLDETASGTGKATTVIVLRGGSFARTCGRTVSSTRTASGATKDKPKTVRRLWGKGKGHFRTRGRYSSGTVRGTWWLTSDRCDGTRTYVAGGVVRVYDFVLKKHVNVRTGHSYLASPGKNP
jgi:hypothetical protein